MKKMIMPVVLLLIGAGTTLAAQKIKASDVPQAVQNAFKDSYPDATDVEWEMEDSSTYEVEFEINDVDHEAIFEADGQWIETEIELKKSELPEEVTKAFKAKYPKKKIKEAVRIESYKKGVLYELEYRSGFTKKEAVFDSGGEFISESKD